MKESIYRYVCDRCGIGDTAHIPTAGPDWPLNWTKVYADTATIGDTRSMEVDLCIKCTNEFKEWVGTVNEVLIEEF